MREHFLPYGDISNVELEGAEGCNGSSESEVSKDCSACISFIARRSAERAFVNGKCWQGHNLKFVWLPSNNPSNDQSGRENSPSASKEPGEKVACIVSQEIVSSSNEEPKIEEEKNVEDMEPDEDSRRSPSPTSVKEESPKGDMS